MSQNSQRGGPDTVDTELSTWTVFWESFGTFVILIVGVVAVFAAYFAASSQSKVAQRDKLIAEDRQKLAEDRQDAAETRQTEAETKQREHETKIAELTVTANEATERAASANERAARAAERAAKLEKEAAEARLEVERLKSVTAWRRLDDEAARAITETLSKKPGKINFAYVGGDTESAYFMGSIAQAFHEADWQVTITEWRDIGPEMFGVSLEPKGDDSFLVREALGRGHVQLAFVGELDRPRFSSGSGSLFSEACTLFVGSRYPVLLKPDTPEADTK